MTQSEWFPSGCWREPFLTTLKVKEDIMNTESKTMIGTATGSNTCSSVPELGASGLKAGSVKGKSGAGADKQYATLMDAMRECPEAFAHIPQEQDDGSVVMGDMKWANVAAYKRGEKNARRIWQAYARHMTRGAIKRLADGEDGGFYAVSPSGEQMFLPIAPDKVYAGQGWVGWQDWLGMTEGTIRAEAIANAARGEAVMNKGRRVTQ